MLQTTNEAHSDRFIGLFAASLSYTTGCHGERLSGRYAPDLAKAFGRRDPGWRMKDEDPCNYAKALNQNEIIKEAQRGALASAASVNGKCGIRSIRGV
jgi:hypothetical protein